MRMSELKREDLFKRLDDAAALAAVNLLLPAAARVAIASCVELLKDQEARVALLEERVNNILGISANAR